MSVSIDAQMKKGILEMCLLQIVVKSDKENAYGYQILKCFKVHFPEISESTIYAILRRICENGYTKTYRTAVSNGPQRKYYEITDEGRVYLSALTESFKGIVDVIKSLEII